MELWSQAEASKARHDLMHRVPADTYRSFGIFSVGMVLLQENPDAWGIKYTLFDIATSDAIRDEFLSEEQDNIVIGPMDMPHHIERQPLRQWAGVLANAGRVG